MALQRLFEASEKAKIELSSAQETQINLPFITADQSGPEHLAPRPTRASAGAAAQAKIDPAAAQEPQINLPFITADQSGPKHLDLRLTRSKMTELVSGLLERIVAPVRQALDDAKDKGVKDVDHVVLVGGMTRMPAVQERVKEIHGQEPHRGVKPHQG